MTPNQALIGAIRSEIKARHANLMFLAGQLTGLDGAEKACGTVDLSTRVIESFIDALEEAEKATAQKNSESLPNPVRF